MTTKSIARLVPCVFSATVAVACSGGGAGSDPTPSRAEPSSQDRPTLSVDAPRAILSRHVPEAVLTHLAPLVGAPAPGTRLHLSVSLPLTDEAGLDAFLDDIYDPSSPRFHHYLSVAEFTRRFAPTAESYQRAAESFAGQGLAVHAVAPNRIVMDMDGSVADIERAFHVTLGLYRHPTEDRLFYSLDREPTLDFATPVLHVTGLDNFQLPTPRLGHHDDDAAARISGSGPSGFFIGSDMRAAYYGSGTLTGAGQSVGLMELGNINLADVDLFFTTFGPPLTADIVPVVAYPYGGDGTCGKLCDDSEQMLDVVYSVSMAPGLAQVQVYVGANAEDVLSRMASDNTSLQLSTSWGWSHSEAATDEPLWKEMQAQGQSFLSASGDHGNLKASGPWPEESSFLTAVGGTELSTATAGGPWSGESCWYDSCGGPSLADIAIKPYQLPFITTANMGSTTVRNVPDLAAAADGFTICLHEKVRTGYYGTSFSSPIWTGFIALANEYAASMGKPPVGFVNRALYNIARTPTYTTAFHDVISGGNGTYSAGPIYDLVTGLGSPSGDALVEALVGP